MLHPFSSFQRNSAERGAEKPSSVQPVESLGCQPVDASVIMPADVAKETGTEPTGGSMNPASEQVAHPSAKLQQTNSVPFRYTRLQQGEKIRTDKLSDLMNDDDIATQSWLFVSPHDDDLCLGSGLLLQAAVQAGVDVRILVVTDGSLGYCTAEQQTDIVTIRRDETLRSFELLGIAADHVHYMNFPDGGLLKYQGRRPATDEPQNIAGYVGLQNSFTYYLRQFRPTRVFVPTHTDLHPDHRYAHSELMVSLFHSAGTIWPELGAPLIELPKVYEMAIYCDFSTAPNIEIIGNEEVFEHKLKSIEAYQSQLQIGSLIKIAREAGPYEYLREVNFRLYSPTNYRALFA